jgi:hypothetical protein
MAAQFHGIKHTIAFYKANYIIQVFTKTFIKKYFVQNVMLSNLLFMETQDSRSICLQQRGNDS